MPDPAFCFYWHSYKKYVKIVFTSTYQTKLKKILIKQNHVIRIIFHVNEETRPRPSFLDVCQIDCSKSSYSYKELKDLCVSPSVFFSYFKIINHVHET